VPVLTPCLELEDGRVLVAGDLADEITSSTDGSRLGAVWKQWAVVGEKANEHIGPGLITVVTWRIQGESLIRTETICSSELVRIRASWAVVPSTGDACVTHFTDRLRTDRCDSPEGSWEATVTKSDWPIEVSLRATGDSTLGRGNRGAVPLYLEFESSNTELRLGKPMHWEMVLRAIPADVANNGKTSLKSRMDAASPGEAYLH